jgi:hypothetical protein
VPRVVEAMAAIPELQHPTVTSLRPRDIAACLTSNLWGDLALVQRRFWPNARPQLSLEI